jgi:hypothetical protein
MTQFHDVADIFPLMDDRALTDLATDIAANGLREPIWLHPDGRIIDGRNRFLACERLGIVPASRSWDGTGSLVTFIVSLNLHRRHLTNAQRGLVAGRIANLDNGYRAPLSGDKGAVTQAEAASLLNISATSVQRGHAIIARGAPELVAAVERGDVTIGAASLVVHLPPSEQREILAQGGKAVAQKAEALRSAARRQSTGPRVPVSRRAAPKTMPDRSPTAVERRVARIRELAAEGTSVQQMAEALELKEGTCRRIINREQIDVPASRAIGKTHRHDANRIVAQMVMDAEHLTADVNLIDFAALDRGRLNTWVESLTISRQALVTFIHRLIKEQQYGKAAQRTP